MFLALAPPYAASAARASAFPDGRRRSGDTSIALGHASVQLSEEPSSMAWADARACSRVAAARTLFRMQLLLLQHRPTKQLCFGSAARRARILPGHRRCHLDATTCIRPETRNGACSLCFPVCLPINGLGPRSRINHSAADRLNPARQPQRHRGSPALAARFPVLAFFELAT
jgi:hypothetical protein